MRSFRLGIAFILLLASAQLYSISSVYSQTDRVLILSIDGTIDAGYSDLVARVLTRTDVGQYVIIVLKTNGGYLKPTQDIVYTIINSGANVTVFIPPGGFAYSAGAYISVSADILAMAPGSVIGSAEPRDLAGNVDPKVLNAMSEWMASLAELRGRDVEAARAMVTENRDYTAREAVDIGIADLIVSDMDELINVLDISDLPLEYVGKDIRSEALSIFSNPLLAGILLNIAALLILIELMNPTFIGFIAAIALLILSFLGLGYIGADATALILLIIGISAIVAETWIGEGELAVGGAILTVIGILMLYRAEQFIWTFNYRLFVIGGIIIIVLVVGFLGFYLHKIREVVMKGKSPLDIDALIGKEGVVKQEVGPGKVGIVLVESDLWSAISDQDIGVGEKVVVVGVEGVILKVVRK
ncbi:MAG TPA: nodulation protein NfeD [Thermoprotei archaeon]|nr:nodulation protein NfeD [Thermoprotei archaeon]